ncbi:MAG: PilZ domain-containing protein [Proteobacteria bacterium]|nr:PilZ domain-containing protein [Pseudomonadota bacterium]
MTTPTPAQKSFVKSGDEATIICPQCNSAKIIAVRQFRHRLHRLIVKCRCGYSFKVQLEFRRHYRKPTDLPGIYDPVPPAVSGGKAKVINLSLSGACFELRGVHDLQIGQKGVLVFTLDNRKESVLTKSIFIRSISGNRIGGEFVEDRAFDKELGFYLRP